MRPKLSAIFFELAPAIVGWLGIAFHIYTIVVLCSAFGWHGLVGIPCVMIAEIFVVIYTFIHFHTLNSGYNILFLTWIVLLVFATLILPFVESFWENFQLRRANKIKKLQNN